GLPNKKAIHFGAGNIGRGLIGPLLVQSGYHVVFSDVNEEIIQELNNRDSYDVQILEKERSSYSISSISGIQFQSDDLIREFADPKVDLVTTAVGATILENTAPTIAKGLQARRSTTKLRDYVFPYLSAEDKEWVTQNIGFANCSSIASDNPLDVGVEAFYEWVVDKSALHHTRLDVQLKGYSTVDQAIEDPHIHDIVYGALMREGGAALIRKHRFDAKAYSQYVDKVMERFSNPRLKDELVRVGRQPLRKLSKGDRLLGPRTWRGSMGIAAAFLYDVPNDEQSVELQTKIKQLGIEDAVADVTGFAKGSEEHGKIIEAYDQLQREVRH
ncbi:Mannitol-1-phosphate 5-dehydrogenase, partial [Grifola frondosa]